MLKQQMQYKKSTKGTYVYGNDDPSAHVSTLYVSRGSMDKIKTPGGDVPQVITVTVEVK